MLKYCDLSPRTYIYIYRRVAHIALAIRRNFPTSKIEILFRDNHFFFLYMIVPICAKLFNGILV